MDLAKNMKKFTSKLNKAFTLIEIMIFVSLLSMVLVVIVAYVTRLLMNMKVNEHKIFASFYVEETSEWLINERYADWNAFQARAGSPAGIIYCVNKNFILTDTIAILDPSYWTTTDPNRSYRVASINNCPLTGINGLAPSIYRRTITLTKDAAINPTRVNAQIVVSWVDNGVNYSQQLETVYTAR